MVWCGTSLLKDFKAGTSSFRLKRYMAYGSGKALFQAADSHGVQRQVTGGAAADTHCSRASTPNTLP